MVEADPHPDREESTVSVERVLRYVARVLGDEAVARVIERAQLGDRVAAVTRPGGWCRAEEVVAVAEAAAALCHEPDIGRRVGEQQFHEQLTEGVIDYLRSAGSFPDALRYAVEFGTANSTVRRIALDEVGDGWAEISMATTSGGAPWSRFFCSKIAGYLALVPAVFGWSGAAVERTCQHLGADRCRFRLVWDESTPALSDRAAGEAGAAVRRFEQLQAVAVDVTRPEEVDAVLDRVVTGLSTSIAAERVAAAVRLPGERRPRLTPTGFPAHELEHLADRVLDGSLGAEPGTVSVIVRSASHDYGWLVAVLPEGTVPTEADRRMAVAHASRAAVALDGAVTLAGARRSQAVAEALLVLAGSLARTTDMDEIACLLVDATTVVTGADQAVMLLWDPEEGAVNARAWVPRDAVYAGLSLPRADIPELVGEESLQARAVDVPGANPLMAEIMRAAGTSHAVTVPISAHDEYLGTLVAGYAGVEPPVFDDELIGRMRGIADQAAAAVLNVRLLDQIRHQALHDPLTGLPNRPLMEDRANLALAHAERSGASVGLLFLDLDRFKEVNDTLGHAVGDELLRAVADRLRRIVRSSDTVSRQGGDEFLVLLPDQRDEVDARLTAEKILHGLDEPFHVGGTELAVSASIGVAVAPGGTTSYRELVHRADLAMYRAKESGRHAVVLDDGGDAPA